MTDVDTEASVTIEITQKPASHPLPLQHYLEVKPPVGEVARSDVVTRRMANYSYIHTFNLGERTSRQIEMLKASDMEFRIYHKTKVIEKVGPHDVKQKGKPVLIALATAPLAPLSYSMNNSAPLNFMAIDGKRTSFLFEVRMTLGAPLVAVEDLYVNETIDVIRD
jgi:hypothetical protein